jgi:hypothetical protein
MARHLRVCQLRAKAISASGEGSGQMQPIYHLEVRGAWQGDYWLHLEMRGSARLQALDRYLRRIWLECCGHLSHFSIGGWDGDPVPISRRAEDVFWTERKLTHIYDYGTTSMTTIRVVDLRRGKPLTPRRAVFLMARNMPPEIQCMECERAARWWCYECMCEHNESGALCDQHAQAHPHRDYGDPVPIVNSPRTGMCGYIGPADPP